MRKIFLNAAALSLALLTVSPALQSCKDYDDDITNINDTNNDLAKQILDLQKQVEDLSEAQKNAATAAANAANAAEAARKLAEEAVQAGNKAEADALAAQAMASDAKAAAEQAKAEMLSLLTKEAEALKTLINKNSSDVKTALEKVAENAQNIAQLDGKVAAIDAKLANYSTTADMVAAINKAIADNNANIYSTIYAAKADLLAQINAVATRVTAVETQQATMGNYITALQTNYSALSGKVDGLATKIDTQEIAINNLQSDLTAINTKLTAFATELESTNTKISGLETEISTLDGKLTTVSSKVSNLENELNTLTTLLLPGRLSSVTLIPNLYIGGIPTIEFMTISYNQWEADADKAGLYNMTNKKSEITSNDAIAHYRLNPNTVGEKDIKLDQLSFVSTRAISRAENVSALNVSKASINDGILDVWVKNNNAGKLSDDSKSEITIAALCVPIADSHLFENEKTSGASIYSEYSRVAESYITPVIKAIKSSDIEDYDLTQYDLENFADNANINTSLSSNDFIAIDVVYNGDGQNLLDIVEGQYGDPAIVVSKDELNAWGLDFEFVLFGKELSPDAEYATISDSTIKATAPESGKLSDAIGKTPWIAVLLKDVANDQIIDAQYVQVKFVQDIRPVSAEFAENIELFCGEKTITVDWDWMKENILAKLNATNDMTPEEFISIYKDTKIVATAPNGDDVEADLVAEYDVETNAYTWTISSGDLDMTKLENQEFIGQVVCTDPHELYPTVTVNIKITVEISNENLPVLGKGNFFWKDGENGLQEILAYPTNPKDATADQVAEYNTDILQGRLAPYATNFLDCALWGTYFNDTKYTDEDNKYVWFTTEYSNYATQFINGELPATKAALSGLLLNFWIENNEAGIEMVQNQEKVLVDWKANLVGNTNSDNAPTFGQCWIQVVQPLFYNQTKSLAITDNVGTSITCDLSGSWVVKDYYDNVVVNTEVYNYRSFYVLEDIEYNVENAYMTRDADPASQNLGSCAEYKISVSIEDNTLSYKNEGAILQDPGYIQIPVSLPHRWGTLNGTITVKLNKFK